MTPTLNTSIGWEKRPAWANVRSYWDERVKGRWVTVSFSPNQTTPWRAHTGKGVVNAYSLPELLRLVAIYIKKVGLPTDVARNATSESETEPKESNPFADQNAEIENIRVEEEELHDAMTAENTDALTK